jgi:hypothetical protein
MVRPKLRSIGPANEGLPAEESAEAPVVEIDKAGESASAVTEAVRSPRRLTPMPDPNAMKQSSDRMQEIEARRDSVLKRNAERAVKKPPSAPLPVPPSASAPQPR